MLMRIIFKDESVYFSFYLAFLVHAEEPSFEAVQGHPANAQRSAGERPQRRHETMGSGGIQAADERDR